jgi:hypothetical protein
MMDRDDRARRSYVPDPGGYRARPPLSIADEASLAFAEAGAEVSQLLTRTLLMAQRAVEAAVAEAEDRAAMVIVQAEEHARIVGERARRIIDESLEQEHRQLRRAVTESHGRLLDLLDEALRRLDAMPDRGHPIDDAFFAELRDALTSRPADRPRWQPTPTRAAHRHRRSGASRR